MWVIYALFSALGAALVAILAKLGLEEIDSTLATTIRAIIMAIFLVLVSLLFHKFDGFTLGTLSSRSWILISLAGIAGALSWLFYFLALKTGVATGVVAIDRLSIVLVVILAAVFLGEAFTWKVAFGAVLVVAGALLISFK